MGQPLRLCFNLPLSWQLKVLPRDLQLCSETASGVDVGGQHEWGELVQLDPQTVGVIVRLERETFQVCVLHSVVGLTFRGLHLSLSRAPHLGKWQSMALKPRLLWVADLPLSPTADYVRLGKWHVSYPLCASASRPIKWKQ